MNNTSSTTDKRLSMISLALLNRVRSIEKIMSSELLSLAFTSDVNDPNPKQFLSAQQALKERERALASGWDGRTFDKAKRYLSVCENIVKTHLEERSFYFGKEQCVPFDEYALLAKEGRDIFIIIKFIDEEPHIQSTIDSLLSQAGCDHERIVIIGVDNMSTDRSGQIFREMQNRNTTPIRMIYEQQPTPGGGNAARLGVDKCIATIFAMSQLTGDKTLLHRAYICVSDGDTVYHPSLVADAQNTFDNHQDVDGIMPFLTYKFSACLRLFDSYVQKKPEDLEKLVACKESNFVKTTVSLRAFDAHKLLPRQSREVCIVNQISGMQLKTIDGQTFFVPFIAQTDGNEKFGVFLDQDGNRAYIFENRHLILEKAPYSGFENTLVFLENSAIGSDNVWRWHGLIGHDIFLLWAFAEMGLSENLILPDTSDALKGFRAWAFAVGGQHQLSRPGIKRVTGTDYQSGRVLQSFGARTILGSSHCHSETEIDRLAKMVRNFAHKQAVFYGNTRAESIDRASGLYLHMTKIQDKIEAEVRGYPEQFYKEVVFPERIIFPFRWMIQNFICSYAMAENGDRENIYNSSFKVILSTDTWREICDSILTDDAILDLINSEYESLRKKAEKIAEKIIETYWKELISFYSLTLRSFFFHHEVASEYYDFLLEALSSCRNGILDDRPEVNVNNVWANKEFEIDEEKGQVSEMNTNYP